MTKSEIVARLSEEFHLTPRLARLIVDSFFSNIMNSLATGDKVILRRFGTFSVKVAKERTSRNPQTGEYIHVKARKSVVFKISAGMHKHLNPEETPSSKDTPDTEEA